MFIPNKSRGYATSGRVINRPQAREKCLTDSAAEASRRLAALASRNSLAFERALGVGNTEKIKEFWFALKGMPLNTAPSPIRDPGVTQQVAGLVHRHLKSLVDEWIDSGIRKDGLEEPYTRTLSPKRLSELQDCLRTGGIGVVYIANRGGVDTSISDRDFPELDNAHSKSRLIRAAVRKRQQRSTWLRTHSALEQFFDTDSWSLDWSDEPSRELFAYREAQRLFFVFLSLDGARFRLFRCATKACGFYDFCRPKRDIYKRGWHCTRHMKSAARTASASRIRDEVKERRFNFATQAMKKAAKGHSIVEVEWLEYQKQRLLEEINDRLSPSEYIKLNWVTANLYNVAKRAGIEVRR